MSRLDSSGRLTVKPKPNVYTILALISALATLGAMVFTIMQWNVLVRLP
jgi:hypothetical protein